MEQKVIQTMNNEEILVPLIVFTSIVVLIAVMLAYQLLKKRQFIKLLEQHGDMQPDAIAAVGRFFFASQNDLRKGVFLLIIALAIWGFSFLVDFRSGGNLDLNQALNGIALFPCFSGFAYLLLFYASRGK